MKSTGHHPRSASTQAVREKPAAEPASSRPPARGRLAAQLALAFVGVALLLGWLQFAFTPDICCGDFDGYYHIQWSRQLWDGLKHAGLPAFSSLPLTTLSPGQYADQHFLFHLLLMPFTWFRSLVLGAKLAAVLFASAAIVCCFWLVLRYRIRYASLWLLALLGSSALFLERMSMTRAQSLSLVFITVGVMLLFERNGAPDAPGVGALGWKYRWLALAAFAYVWAYNLFILLAVLAFLWAIAGWWTERRFEWAPIAWTAVGIVAGFVVNPYFPRNVRLFWENLAGKTALASGAGSEWYALPSWLLLKSSFIAFAAMLIGYLAFGYLLNDAAFERPRASTSVSGRSVGISRLRRPLFFLLVATLLLLLTARSKRFAEYWPPCAVLFAAFTLQAVWDRQSEAGRGSRSKSDNRLKTATLIFLVGGGAYALWMAGQTMSTRVPLDQYRGGAEWLRAHAPAGETVFNVNWDDFPKLYYYDPSRPYVSGLDPLYLSDADPELERLYERIATGKEENPGNMIRSRFGAQYVFASKPLDRAFYMRAMFSGQFDKAYEDQQCLILKVRD